MLVDRPQPILPSPPRPITHRPKRQRLDILGRGLAVDAVQERRQTRLGLRTCTEHPERREGGRAVHGRSMRRTAGSAPVGPSPAAIRPRPPRRRPPSSREAPSPTSAPTRSPHHALATPCTPAMRQQGRITHRDGGAQACDPGLGRRLHFVGQRSELRRRQRRGVVAHPHWFRAQDAARRAVGREGGISVGCPSMPRARDASRSEPCLKPRGPNPPPRSLPTAPSVPCSPGLTRPRP